MRQSWALRPTTTTTGRACESHDLIQISQCAGCGSLRHPHFLLRLAMDNFGHHVVKARVGHRPEQFDSSLVHRRPKSGWLLRILPVLLQIVTVLDKGPDDGLIKSTALKLDDLFI